MTYEQKQKVESSDPYSHLKRTLSVEVRVSQRAPKDALIISSK